MNLTEKLKQIKELDALINERYPWDAEKGIGPILDGYVDIEKYFNAKYRILWILKEPHDEIDDNNEPCGGGWDLKEVLPTKNSVNDMGREMSTFQSMIYTSYGILNNFCQWRDIPSISQDDVFNTFKSISYINVKKLPGYSKSYEPVIRRAYDDNKDILLKQFEIYEPHVIIGGSTLQHFLNDLGLQHEDQVIRVEGSFPHYIKGKQVFIKAYHPAQISCSEENYCNDIINTVSSVHSIFEN